jgi:translation initiation factor 1
VTKNLKNMLACGGTHKDDTIELQGNHKDDAIKALIKLGYNESNIDVA